MDESVTHPNDQVERWLPVVGWESYYLVSDLGRVRSLPRPTASGRHVGRILKPQKKGPPGYLYPGLTLSGGGVKLQVKVHRLVLQAFIGPAPEGMNDGRHLDGEPFNCALTNLAWGTHAQNGQDMIGHGRAKGPGDGSRHPQAKLTEDIVIRARIEYAAGGITERVLAARYDVNVGTIHHMLKRDTWDHV